MAEVLKSPETSFRETFDAFGALMARDIAAAKGFKEEVQAKKMAVLTPDIVTISMTGIVSAYPVEKMIEGFFKRSFVYWIDIEKVYKQLVDRGENSEVNFVKEHFGHIFPPEIPKGYLDSIELLWGSYLDLKKKQSWVKYVYAFIRTSLRYVFLGRKPLVTNPSNKMSGLTFGEPNFMNVAFYRPLKKCNTPKCIGCSKCGELQEFQILTEMKRFNCNFERYL